MCDFLALIQNLGKLLAIDLRPFSSFAESILMPCLVYVSGWVQKRCGQATLTGGECVEDGNEPQSRREQLSAARSSHAASLVPGSKAGTGTSTKTPLS